MNQLEHAGEGAEGTGAVVQAADQHIRQHIQPLHQVELLEDHGAVGAPVAQRLAAQARHLAPGEEDLAFRGFGQAVDHPQQGGFAGAGAADDAHHLPGRHGKGDVIHGHDRAEAAGKVADVEHASLLIRRILCRTAQKTSYALMTMEALANWPTDPLQQRWSRAPPAWPAAAPCRAPLPP